MTSVRGMPVDIPRRDSTADAHLAHTAAHHGFTQADTPAYSPHASERHRTELLDLFQRTL